MSRAVAQVFETYQAARTQFVQSVAELATRPQNIEALANANVMALLRPLLLDTVPSIQTSAAMALGRLANYSEPLAEAVVMNEVLPQLVISLAEQNRHFKKTAAFVLKSVAKHSPELAQAVVEAGSLEALVGCLSEFEPAVKEAAAWALGYIARHNAQLAQNVVDAGAVSQLVLGLQEPELAIKRIAASTLSEIAKHSAELAQIVVDAGAVPYLAPLIAHSDAKLKRQVCACLSQIAKHHVDLAEVVVEAEIFPKINVCLTDPDAIVRKNAATLIREVAKHTTELAQMVVNMGGHVFVIEYTTKTKGAARLPGIMTLGYLAGFSETLARAIILKQGIAPLKDALVSETEDHIRGAAAWSLGQIGKHSPDHAEALAVAPVLGDLVAIYAKSTGDLQTKCQRALKLVIQQCNYLQALDPLLKDAPEKILKYVVCQFSKVLPKNHAARKAFIATRGLARVLEMKQELKADATKDQKAMQQYIATIVAQYPSEIVLHYLPNRDEHMISRLDALSGDMPSGTVSSLTSTGGAGAGAR